MRQTTTLEMLNFSKQIFSKRENENIFTSNRKFSKVMWTVKIYSPKIKTESLFWDHLSWLLHEINEF